VSTVHPRLSGGRPWSPSGHQVEQDKPAPRHVAEYRCPKDGHKFEVPFSGEGDVETPRDWECRQHGVPAALVNGYRGPDPTTKPARTHWAVLLERRSIADLEALLQERLAELAADRKTRTAPRRRARPRTSRSAANA
jgi:hypothetical protein